MVMECTGFSSPRTDAFPAGLRVLVVDDDPTWLKILEKMLKKCSYEVTTCGLATEALDLLREKRHGFDIVISDVNMPDMDGFKLLEHVGLEMDLPVIMMSVDGETSRVMKGVQHGACDYLLKPIRMKELKNIWQHVFRKRIHEVRDTDSHDGLEEIQMMIDGSDYTDDTYLFSGTDLSSGKKRKDAENKHDDKEYSDTSSLKKARVVWTVDLHQKFVKAVDQIGLDKVGPKRILDLMGVQWLTRENVASHLQKYRLYLSRLQKDNELKASFGGLKQSVLSPRDPAGNVCLQNPLNTQLNDVTNDNCGISGSKNLMHNIDSQVHEGGMKSVIPVAIAEPKKAPSGDTTDSKKISSPKMSFNQSFQLPDSDIKYPATIPSQYSWSAEYPEIQFKQESNARHYQENKFNHLPLPSLQHHVQVDRKQPGPSFNFRPSDEVAAIEVKPPYVKNRSQGIVQASQAETKSGTFPIQPDHNLPSCHSLEPIPTPTWSRKSDFSLDQVLLSGSAFGSLDRELLGYSLHGNSQPLNISLENVESFNYNDPELLAAVPLSLYESLKFDYEHPFDSMEYPVIDQSLFIV